MSRALVGVVAWLLVGVPVVWADEAEDKAVARVEESGGIVSRDDKRPGKPVTGLLLSGDQATDETFAVTGSFRKIQHLSLLDTAMTADGYKGLSAFPDMMVLHLVGQGVSDIVLEHVVTAPKLSSLTLKSTAVTDEGLHRLARLKSLNHLSLEPVMHLTGVVAVK